jgi:hypothetical protein
VASVFLSFVPPDIEGLASLHIEEAPAAVGVWAEIETVAAIGAYPNYITDHTTNAALAVDDWFRIRWGFPDNTFTAYSAPWKGGTTTLVAEIVRRVRERDPSLNVEIVAQEAEAVIQRVFGDNVDPYDVTLTATYRQINGLTYLVMARSYVFAAAGIKDVQSATLGLVSFRTESGQQRNVDVQALLDLANIDLGFATSRVLELEDIFDPDSLNYFFKNINPVNILEL